MIFLPGGKRLWSDTGTTASRSRRLSFVRRLVSRNAQRGHAASHVHAVSDRGVPVHFVRGQHRRPVAIDHTGDQEHQGLG